MKHLGAESEGGVMAGSQVSDYLVTYFPDTDDLTISRSDGTSRVDTDEFVTYAGTLLVASLDRTLLLALTISDFSSRVDFTDVYELFGADVVKLLARIQADLGQTSRVVHDIKEPLRSRHVREHLVPA
jgi:hypothetical protein